MTVNKVNSFFIYRIVIIIISDDDSPLLATRYSKITAQVINSIYKNLIVIYVTIALATFSILDVLGILFIIGLYSDVTYDIIVAIISSILLVILSLVFLYILKTRKILNLW